MYGVIGAVAGVGFSFIESWQACCLIGWDLTAALLLGRVWWRNGRLDAESTKRSVLEEDPGVALADLLLLTAGLVCLGGVALVLVKAAASGGSTKAIYLLIGVVSVLASWATVHSVFALRYARLYYRAGGAGIDFNDPGPPNYMDFAYAAFTIGMTFQVSDTDLTSKEVRRTALKHALLSYLFGAVIVGLMINVIASLLR
jgi:uncharacterized membrane protein